MIFWFVFFLYRGRDLSSIVPGCLDRTKTKKCKSSSDRLPAPLESEARAQRDTRMLGVPSKPRIRSPQRPEDKVTGRVKRAWKKEKGQRKSE